MLEGRSQKGVYARREVWLHPLIFSQETPGESLENKLQSPTQTGILKGPSHTEQDRQDQHSVHEL